ncbi:hypothetical protein P7K49_002360 [Saguinus oedipus]|uniref:Uncharacterized protein n=1 Tax=Saguinus oedipus TaxID=9490 RepID=A0ABQ9WH56_SAGOE|nr:hypothetical protein P7K49_002360 [Saguinus oedipus]
MPRPRPGLLLGRVSPSPPPCPPPSRCSDPRRAEQGAAGWRDPTELAGGQSRKDPVLVSPFPPSADGETGSQAAGGFLVAKAMIKILAFSSCLIIFPTTPCCLLGFFLCL